MLCGNCSGHGHILVKLENEDSEITYEAFDCPECLGVGEIRSEDTPMYPDSHGNDDY